MTNLRIVEAQCNTSFFKKRLQQCSEIIEDNFLMCWFEANITPKFLADF